MAEKITISLIKADIGSYPGHGRVHPDLIKTAKECLQRAKDENLLIDFFVTNCGDDLCLLLSHKKFIENPEIHKLAFDTFMKCTEVAKGMKLYGAGQDLISTAFSGNIRGMGPGVAEMSFFERESEPLVVFLSDKAEAGMWNLYLFKIFADPFTTPGLIIDPKLHDGFSFEVHDVIEHKKIIFKCPNEMYDLLVFIGAPSKYCIKSVVRNSDNEIAAVTSVEKLSLTAGGYRGKDDSVMMVRSQSGFPAVGEILEPFAFPALIAGGMRGSHHVPVMAVSLKDAHPTRFDSPARVVALGFQLNGGNFIGPIDLFDDPAFDLARQKCNEVMDYIRKHGPFEPHRLPLSEMEYTTLPYVMRKLKNRFQSLK
ncbi:MAG: fructose-1,6-bisphosphate aldolase/phosphatase [Candidatus Aenigmarchaeota archaeon]|nr:fructose-1,6-bisphosphate aldolase/phosphatase [Candidatus Aenigmarchaeota archaeon]